MPARAPVPWRTIWATIASVVVALACLLLLRELTRIIAWLVVALFFGALLAIPGAGVLQVVVRDLYDERRGRLKAAPTIGTDETPLPATD